MRNNQGNRQRGRGNRNRHRSGSGGGNSGGGNSANKVFDSNGPDVKLRGTAQTVAEKYMQLGRDAQSSGDNVAAESYYQHAEHYYRIWAANQPQGASLQMTKKLGEEEFEEEGADEGGDDEGAEGHAEAVNGEALEAQGDQATAEAGEGQHQRQNNNGTNNGQQRGTRNERFRPRWQNNRNNRDRYNQDGNPEQPEKAAGAEPHAAAENGEAPGGQWEAPSFLQRPTPAPVASGGDAEAPAQPPRRGRPRREREEVAPTGEEPTPQAE